MRFTDLSRFVSQQTRSSQRLAQVACLGLVPLLSMPAAALSYSFGDGLIVDIDTTFSYAGQWRMERPDADIYGATNPGLLQAAAADDGSRAFARGDMTQNRFSFSTDLDLQYGDSGLFVRARGWYDDVYANSPNGSLLSPASCDRTDCSNFDSDGIEDYHKSRIELQDIFIYHAIDFDNGQSLSLRLGEQVVNWGESLALYGGISSAQGPLDASKANVPGAELKDIFMPIGQLYAELSLSETVSLGAYYQYDWQRTRIDAPGSYFGLDILGEGSVGQAFGLLAPLAPLGTGDQIITEQTPDKGQWGITVRYLAEELNSTEFAFYYLQYNDTIPAFEWDLAPAGTAAYVLGIGGAPMDAAIAAAGADSADINNSLVHRYFEDIDLIGLSFGTVVGDTNVSGEVSYRDGQAVQLAWAGGYIYAPAKTVQAQVSALHILGATVFADNIVLTGELAYNSVVDIDQPDYGQSLGLDVNSTSSALDNDREAMSYILRAQADYFNLLPTLDMKVTATFRHDFDGISSVPFTFTEGRKELNLSASFIYQSQHRFGLSYVNYLTDPGDLIEENGQLEFGHLFADRDYVSVFYKYNF